GRDAFDHRRAIVADNLAEAVAALRHNNDYRCDDPAFALAASDWIAGGKAQPSEHDHAGARKLELPTYPFERQRYAVGPPVAPAATIDLRARIESCWKERLCRDELPPGRSFFELGGSSVAAADLIGRLNREFGLGLRIADLFGAPDIESFIERA